MVKTYGDLYQDTRRALARQAPPQDPGVLARLLVCQASGKTQAQFLADRIAVLYEGRFVEYGDTDAVLHAPSHPYTQRLLRAMPRLNRDAGGGL